MNASTTSKLDAAKFAKVRSLMDSGSTAGERAAASVAAAKMAKGAGLSLDQAMSKMDAAPTARPANIFDGFEDWCEAREPGFKSKQAAERAQREAERKIRLARVVRHYGSEEAVFDETERERRLRETLEPLADRKPYSNSPQTFIEGYAGWTCREPKAALWDALAQAYPLPSSLTEAWREYCEWESLQDDRCTVEPHSEQPVHIRARCAALEHLLDTMADPSLSGVRARIAWLNHLANREWSRDASEDKKLARALAADFETLAAQDGRAEGVTTVVMPSSRRTNADKRRDVRSMLDAEPGLADREIARRCGVSPQTVGNVRRNSAS